MLDDATAAGFPRDRKDTSKPVRIVECPGLHTAGRPEVPVPTGHAKGVSGFADHLVGEAPLVVVPGHHLDQRAVHGLGHP